MSRVIAKDEAFGRIHNTELGKRRMCTALIGQSNLALPGLCTYKTDLIKLHENDEYIFDAASFDFVASRWWVIRVCSHIIDVEEDLLLPTHALRRTQYLMEDADEICESAKPEDHGSIREIVLNKVPGVVTFVSTPRPEWFDAVRSTEGHLAVLESFRDSKGNTMLRLNGELPRPHGTFLASCVPLPNAAGVLKVSGIAKSLPKSVNSLEYEGETLSSNIEHIGEDVLVYLDSKVASVVGLSIWRLDGTHFELRADSK